jgi:hypothetical protein
MSGKTARLNQSDNIQYVKMIVALTEHKRSVRAFSISRTFANYNVSEKILESVGMMITVF